MPPIILPYKGARPRIDPSAWVADNAAVAGDVVVGAESSIWFSVSIRGDVCHVRIGARTNIQDNTVVHVTTDTHPTIIGDGVTIGHGAILHGCTLEDGCFIGMGAIVMDGAVVETGGMVAAGALIAPGKVVRSGELWIGSPARHVRPLNEAERAFIPKSADHYVEVMRQYRDLG